MSTQSSDYEAFLSGKTLVAPATGIGMDWGACTNAASQYDRQVVFEHWTCAEFRR